MKRLIYAALGVLALAAPAVAQGIDRGALPPHEILTILRSTGFDPLGQPVRRGPNYVLRAVDDTDREVSVVVSARSGAVIAVTPVRTASRMMPPPRGDSIEPYERMPPGYIPPRGYRPGAPIIDDDDSDVDASIPSTPNVITANPDRGGVLPPPPERFPQRAAPAAPPKPKPVQRAAEAPPKAAPLPKPKPAAKPDATPSDAAPLPPRAKPPATDDTPH